MYAKGYGGRQMISYRDQGYPDTDVIMNPFCGPPENLQPYQKHFNHSMSRFGIGIEHEFGRVRNMERQTQYEGGFLVVNQIFQNSFLIFILITFRKSQIEIVRL